jgi:hypothetical protein
MENRFCVRFLARYECKASLFMSFFTIYNYDYFGKTYRRNDLKICIRKQLWKEFANLNCSFVQINCFHVILPICLTQQLHLMAKILGSYQNLKASYRSPWRKYSNTSFDWMRLIIHNYAINRHVLFNFIQNDTLYVTYYGCELDSI